MTFAVFVPEMKEGADCPYCGGPTVNVAFEFITCGAAWNADCFGHQVKTPIPFRCEACEAPTTNPEDDYGEHVCDDCVQNRNERAWERHCTTDHTTLREQQIAALRFK